MLWNLLPDRLNGYLSVKNFRRLDNQMFSVSHIIHTDSNILYLLLSCTGVTTDDNNGILSKWNNCVKT